MPSTPISTSRRAALRSAVGLLGVLAGCGSPAEPSPTPTTSGPPTGAVTDPPHVQLRNPAPEPVVTREGEPTETESDELPAESVERDAAAYVVAAETCGALPEVCGSAASALRTSG